MQDFSENSNDNKQAHLSGTEQPQSSPDREYQQLAIIGRLTANIVHELNNPMQTISGCTTLALEDIANTDELVQYLNLIQTASGRAMEIIALVRSLYAHANSAPKIADVHGLIQSLMPLLKDDLNHKGLVLNIVPPARSVCAAVVDPAVRLALLNLILDLNQYLTTAQAKFYPLGFFKTETAAVLEFILPVEEPALLEKMSGSYHTLDLLTQTHGSLSVKVIAGQTSVQVILPGEIEEGKTYGG